MTRTSKALVVVLLMLALLVAMATAAFAPKRYIAPSGGRPATVSMPHPPPIRGGG